LLDWIHRTVLPEGKIAESDLRLLTLTDNPDEVVSIISAAYEASRRNGQSRGATRHAAPPDRP
jgi:hypothetical protein